MKFLNLQRAIVGRRFGPPQRGAERLACLLLAWLFTLVGGSLMFAAQPKLSSILDNTPAQAGTNALPLAEPERLYLAEIEHRALTLGKRGFPLLKTAVHDADAAKLARLLSSDFQGETIDLSQGSGPVNEAVRIRRLSAERARATSKVVTKTQFVDYLLGLRKQFAKDPTVEIKLVEFAPVEHAKLNGTWQGTCKFRMAGEYAGGAVAEIFLELGFRLLRVADVDDIASDKEWMSSIRVIEGYESTAKRSLLVDVAKARGLDPERLWDNWKMPPSEASVATGGIFVADVDNDGLNDMLISDLTGLFLYRQSAEGRFEEITAKAGLPRNQRSIGNVAMADFNNDGWVDLILANRLFRNTGGGKFEDISRQSNLNVGSVKYILGYTVADFDNDGLLDLYVARSSGPTGRYGKVTWFDGPGGPGNILFRNRGNWQFEDVSQTANARAGRRSCFTAAWLDANSDGWPDVYVINEFGGGVLLVNQKNGAFKEQPLTSGPGDFGSMGLAVGDVNNDGHVDVYTANMFSKSGRRIVSNLSPTAYAPDIMAKLKQFFPGSELYQNLGGLQFSAHGKELGVRAVGWAYGPAFADLDNDGFLDLYATSGFMSVDNQEPDG